MNGLMLLPFTQIFCEIFTFNIGGLAGGMAYKYTFLRPAKISFLGSGYLQVS